jgi:D-3-phosphoglycerate dehydrogenase
MYGAARAVSRTGVTTTMPSEKQDRPAASRRKRVLVLAPISPVAEEILSSETDLIRGEHMAADELERLLPEIEGIYIQAPAVLRSDLINAATRLEVVGTAGSGTERIDVAAATARGVPVVHAAGAAYVSVAEHAVGMMLSLSKLIAYHDRYFHIHKKYPPPIPGGYGHELHAKTVGIVGLGYIGRDLAHKCSAGFGMSVLAYDPYFYIFEARRQGIDLLRDLDEMLQKSDFLAVTCPFNHETKDLIRERHLRLMKPSAYVIVASRGGIVNEADLVTALQQGWIAGAGVDTWDPEPPAPNHPLFEMDNVVLTRHTGGGTPESLDQIAEAVATQVVQALRGTRPDQIVNGDVWPLRGDRPRPAPAGEVRASAQTA